MSIAKELCNLLGVRDTHTLTSCWNRSDLSPPPPQHTHSHSHTPFPLPQGDIRVRSQIRVGTTFTMTFFMKLATREQRRLVDMSSDKDASQISALETITIGASPPPPAIRPRFVYLALRELPVSVRGIHLLRA